MNRFLIDTDPGVDDAHAIMMAVAHPQTQVEALLAVGGNVGLTHTVRNALVMCDQLDVEIPVYVGCGEGLVHIGANAADVHGQNGLGDVELPPPTRQVEAQHAAIALIERVNAAPNKLTLVMLGPLTNLAVALQLDRGLPTKIKRIVVMGGSVTGKGNASVTAEFNIYADPEAAHVVFEAWARAEKRITLVDWELTMRHALTPAMLEDCFAADTPRSRLGRDILQKTLRFIGEKYSETNYFPADPLAMAVAIEPDIVIESRPSHLTIELNGNRTRGQTVVDWGNRAELAPNVDIVLAVDHARFIELFKQGMQ